MLVALNDEVATVHRLARQLRLQQHTVKQSQLRGRDIMARVKQVLIGLFGKMADNNNYMTNGLNTDYSVETLSGMLSSSVMEAPGEIPRC